MLRFLIFSTLLLLSLPDFAQAPPAKYFGGFHNITPDYRDEMSPEDRQEMYKSVKANIVMLAKKGITASGRLKREPSATVKFAFPLRQATGFNDPSFYGISNYVDVDPTTGIKDYNCGNRTYDGHKGTDFFTVPFWWKKKDENAVEVIAAADGILVDKGGIREDTSCAMCPAVNPPADCNKWNAVYLQHADGTLSIYGHMKKNSLTTKVYGDVIKKGEFLGIVASSGNSSGPHLHFETWVDTLFTKLINPWEGPCNPDGNASLWETQQPYYNPQIIKIMSGTQEPETKQCYDGKPEMTYEKNSFALGQESVSITGYVRDNRVGGPAYKLTLYKPDGSIKYNFTLNPFNAFYSWTYFFYTFPASEVNIVGTWKFRTQYANDVTDITFQIYSLTPLDLVSFSAVRNKNTILLNWQTENEQNTDYFEIEKSDDASSFEKIGTVSSVGNGKTGVNDYEFKDKNPQAGVQYYRLKMVDKDGKLKYSNTVKVVFDQQVLVKMFPNPAGNFVVLQNVRDYNSVSITSMSGRKLVMQSIDKNDCRIDISSLPRGVYVVQLSSLTKDLKLKLIKDK